MHGIDFGFMLAYLKANSFSLHGSLIAVRYENNIT